MTVCKDIIFKQLWAFYKSESFCDVRIAFGENEFVSAHSIILSAISPFVLEKYKEFYGNMINIDINGTVEQKCFSCLNAVIEFVYGQDFSIDYSHLPHVRFIMEALCISPLYTDVFGDVRNEECEEMIETVENTSEANVDCLPKNETVNLHVDLGCELPSSPATILKVNDSQKRKIHHRQKYLKNQNSRLQSCLECKYRCYKPSELLVHIRENNHGGNVCSLCLSKFDSNEFLYEHLNKHNHPKPFFCTTCEQRFQTRALLAQHLPKHSSETPYVCPFCKKGFKWKHGLNSHQIVHTKEKKHLCDECGYSTTHAKTLRAHKLTHTGNLFRCVFPGCLHTSVRKENMKIHQATHDNDRPFVCEICGHKFTQSKNLKRHSLVHEANSPKVQLCPHCTFTTFRTDKLKAHILKQHTETVESDLTILADAALSCIKIENLIS